MVNFFFFRKAFIKAHHQQKETLKTDIQIIGLKFTIKYITTEGKNN